MVIVLSSQLSDSGVAALASLPQLEYLELARAPVTDQGLQHLQSCSQLTNLKLYVTKVTPAGLAKFRAARPDVKVESDVGETDFAAERAAAEWVLSVGGNVTVRIGEQRKTVSPSEKLPAEAFEVVRVAISEPHGMTREGLNCLRGRQALEALILDSVPGLTDEWFDAVKGLPKLRSVGAFCQRDGRVTDAIIPLLRTLPALDEVGFGYCQLTDEGFAEMATLPQLRSVRFCCLGLTDAAVEPFVKTQVEYLTFEAVGSTLTSHSVELAARCPRLKMLAVTDYLLTDQSIAALRSCATLTGLRVMQGNDETVARVAKLTQLEFLALQHNRDSQDFTDVGITHLKSHPRLARLVCEYVAMTDEGLMYLAAIPTLREFYFKETRITPAGLAKFKAARPDVKVEGDVAAPDPASERAAAEWVLNRGEEVWVRVDGQDQQARTLAELPSGAFVVTWVVLRKAEPLSKEGMQRLSMLSQLEDLWLYGVPNSGEFIKALPPQSALRGLYTSEISRPDGVIESLRRHPRLKGLLLVGTRWKDRDFEQLATFRG